MAHFTIYRGLDGMPAWATVQAFDDEDLDLDLLDVIRDAIKSGSLVLAVDGGHAIEVV